MSFAQGTSKSQDILDIHPCLFQEQLGLQLMLKQGLSHCCDIYKKNCFVTKCNKCVYPFLCQRTKLIVFQDRPFYWLVISADLLLKRYPVYFLFAIWLPHNKLCATIDGTASLTQC